MEFDPVLVALAEEIVGLSAPGTAHFTAVQQELAEQGFANLTYAEVSRLTRERVMKELGEWAAAAALQQPDLSQKSE